MQTSFRTVNETQAPSWDFSPSRFTAAPRIEARERKVDQVLEDSFPASDPPSWTLGRVTTPVSIHADPPRNDDRVWSSHTTVVVPGGRRMLWQWLASGIGAIGATMLLPISILIIGVPIAFALRGILEALGWLATLIVR